MNQNESCVKIFDLRSTTKPVSVVDMSGRRIPGRLEGSLRRISGAPMGTIF